MSPSQLPRHQQSHQPYHQNLIDVLVMMTDRVTTFACRHRNPKVKMFLRLVHGRLCLLRTKCPQTKSEENL